MTRLTNLKPAIRSLSTRINGHHDDDRTSAGRLVDEPWRAWYRTARWQKLRIKVLARDAWTCRATGELCIGTHHTPNSPVVDHIRPHHGNPELFWSIDNLQCVTKEWHDKVKQAQEKAQNPRAKQDLNTLKGEWY